MNFPNSKDNIEKLRIEQLIQKQQEYQLVLDETIKPKKGHTLFEVNLSTGVIIPAELDKLPPLEWHLALRGDVSVKRTLTKKSFCIYISALNKENVIKILTKHNIKWQQQM